MDVLLMARRCAKALRTTVGALACSRIRSVPSRGERRKGAGVHRHGRYAECLQPRPPRPRSRRSRRPTTSPPTSRAARRRSRRRTSPTTARSCSSTRPATSSTTPRRRRSQDYVQGGGGFVGIGETALFEYDGKPFFNTLLGLSGERITGTGTTSAQDVEFLDRVHPANRAQPLVARKTETWYTWAVNPTGTVHTIARVRGNTLPDGTSITNDAVQRFTDATNANQPQLNRPAAWCRDVQQGRSLYTSLGSNAGSVADESVRKHLLGAVQWAAGMVRGNCKASINSNYSATRITPVQATGSNQFYGEMTKSALVRRRPDLLRRPRDLLPGLHADRQLGLGEHRPRLRHDPRLGRARRGLERPERGQDQRRRRTSRCSAPRATPPSTARPRPPRPAWSA